MKRLFIITILISVLVGLYYFYFSRNIFDFKNESAADENINIELDKKEEIKNLNPITGESCDNFNKRPFAVMLAGDPQTRPLSGISQADLAIEMPVTNSINRLMALFICEEPKEIGSVRSARHDFVPLAKSFDAIFVHWGGSHFALDLLKTGAIDNIDALRDKYNAFYRKTTIPAPDNGFTSYDQLLNAINLLNYRQNNEFEGYPHLNADEFSGNVREKSELIINYSGAYKVKYFYDDRLNEYFRYRANSSEVDKNSNFQVKVKNVIVMFAESRQIDDQYNDVAIEGSGSAVVFRNGEKIKATWKKDKNNLAAKLYFLDESGNEIKLVSGKIWIEVVDPLTGISWSKI